jgi:hypothetical protein
LGNISLEIYHGTISSCAENIIQNGILLKKGKPRVDFGQGFYTTQSYDFAKSTAINKTKKTNMHYGDNRVVPTILRYHMNEDMLKDLNVLRFDKEELELSAMKYSYSTNQISFHTTKGLSCIKLIDCDIITANKQKGVADNE